MKTQGSLFILKCLQERSRLSRASKIFSDWEVSDSSLKISGFRAFAERNMTKEEFEACKDWIDSLRFVEMIDGIDLDVDQMQINLKELQNINAKLSTELHKCQSNSNQFSQRVKTLFQDTSYLNSRLEQLALNFEKDKSLQCTSS